MALFLGALVAAGAHAQTPAPGTTGPPPPPPKAYALVDANAGIVMEAANARQNLHVASLTKLLTALAVVAALPPDTEVPVSERAAGMPARKINMKAGQVWDLEDALHALLLSSANDAGMALAERVAGSGEGFGLHLERAARRLQLADKPVLRDPSGLDDEFSVGGGNLMSARDLAITARAVLAEPRVAPIVATPVYVFTGPDGVAHRLGNHNQLLKTYPGTVGMKTGYTKRSGRCVLAAATRDGRTMIAVVIGTYADYAFASQLLDKGFATPLRAVARGDRLPHLPATLASDGAASNAPGADEAAGAIVTTPSQESTATSSLSAVFAFLFRTAVVVALGFVILRLRARTREQRRVAVRHKGYRVPPPPRDDAAAPPATVREPDPALTARFEHLVRSEP